MIIITETRFDEFVGHAWETKCTDCGSLWKHTQAGGSGNPVRDFVTRGTRCQKCFDVEGQASEHEWEVARWYQTQIVRLGVERERRRRLA